MNFWNRWMLLFLCWLGPLAIGHGQVLENPPVAEIQAEPPPTDGVLDHAGLFHRNPALFAKLTERIGQLRDDHNFLIYIVTESVLVKGNPQSIAMDLRQQWIPNGNGMVFVFEVDSRRLSMGQKLDQTITKEGRMESGVPSYELGSILAKAAEGLNNAGTPEVFLETFIGRVSDGVNDYYKRVESPVPEDRTVRIGMIIIGGAAALALLGLGAAWLLKRSDRQGGGCFFFPETETTERLGAPYGGGEVSSRRFGRGDGAR